MEAHRMIVVSIAAFFGTAILVWAFCTFVLYWTVSRGRIAALAVAIIGGFLGHVFVHLTGAHLIWQFLTPALGAFLILYVAMVASTPRHVTILVDCNNPNPRTNASPWEFLVGKGGSVSWILNGPQGTAVNIHFPAAFNPFGTGAVVFAGVVPGIIAAGPVVNSGRGKYTFDYTIPGQALVTVDPMGVIPKG